MLKRIISAVVALSIVIPLIILGGKYIAVGCGIAAILAYKEIIDLKVSHKKIPEIVQLLGMIIMLLIIYADMDGYSIFFGITYRGIGLFLITMLVPTLFFKNEDYTTKDAFYMIGTILLLSTLFNGLILLRNLDIYLLVYILLIAIASDTFAFAIGKLFGRHKIAPAISPKKTWEGAVGGLVGGTLIATIFYSFMVSPNGFQIKYVLLSAILSIIGQIGDFVFSKIKRENKIKDFSNIMPGHGGILDRLDSIIFVILAYIVLSQMF